MHFVCVGIIMYAVLVKARNRTERRRNSSGHVLATTQLKATKQPARNGIVRGRHILLHGWRRCDCGAVGGGGEAEGMAQGARISFRAPCNFVNLAIIYRYTHRKCNKLFLLLITYKMGNNSATPFLLAPSTAPPSFPLARIGFKLGRLTSAQSIRSIHTGHRAPKHSPFTRRERGENCFIYLSPSFVLLF